MVVYVYNLPYPLKECFWDPDKRLSEMVPNQHDRMNFSFSASKEFKHVDRKVWDQTLSLL